jgi:hypothetical protein
MDSIALSRRAIPRPMKLVVQRLKAAPAKDGAIVVGLFANRSATGWYRDHVVPYALVARLHGRLSPFAVATNIGACHPPRLRKPWRSDSARLVTCCCDTAAQSRRRCQLPERLSAVDRHLRPFQSANFVLTHPSLGQEPDDPVGPRRFMATNRSTCSIVR